MLSEHEFQRLESFGASYGEIKSIGRALETSDVFCYAKPHADIFPHCISKAEVVGCLKSVLDGLRGWQGDVAREVKADVRRWIRRASKTAAT
jgi:hypothetical protein